MSNLKALKTRIKSVKSTQKMTKAMKMVAASRLKKAKNLVEGSRPYASNIEEMIITLASNIRERGHVNEKFPLLTGRGEDKVHLLVVFSSDRGLCGGLNSATVKMVKNYISDLEKSGKEAKIFCVGKKAYEQLKGIYEDKIVLKEFGIFKNEITYESAENIAKQIIDSYEKEEFDVCEVIYSEFKSAILQEQILKQVIPSQVRVDSEIEKKGSSDIAECPTSYEEEEILLSSLLPRNIAMQIYNELLENSASEQGARMAAMEAASNNAGKMIKDLTLVYNRTRQANITSELIDIISGANSV